MTDTSVPLASTLTAKIARLAFVVAGVALSLMLYASTASVRVPSPDTGAFAMVEQGRTALADGDVNAAIDAFEAALVIDPGYAQAFIELAAATREQGLQGKAIGYYRAALARDPASFAAIAGEGEALAEKGMLEQAQRNLARLESLCGANCTETHALQAVIQMETQTRMAVGEGDDAVVN